MFRSNQILTKTELLKHFNDIANLLESTPQALLITQRRREPLVLVNAEIFEDLLVKRLASDGAAPPENTYFKEQLTAPKL